MGARNHETDILLQAELEQARQRMAELESVLAVCFQAAFPFKVLEAIPAPIFVKDEWHCWVYVNRAFSETLGVPVEDLLGKSEPDFYPPDQAREFWAKDNQAMDTGQVVVHEEDIAVHGRVQRFLTARSLFVDPATGQRRVVGYATDITERREMEQVMRRAERDHRNILDSVNAMIWYVDTFGRVTRANRQAAAHCGMSVQDMLGRTVRELFPLEFAEGYARDIQEVLATRQAKLGIVEPGPYPDGKTGWFKTDKIPYLDNLGVMIGMTIMVEDITPHKRIQDELRASEERFRALVESTSDCIFEIDARNRFTYNSPALAQIVGYTPEELRGRTPTFLTGRREVLRIMRVIGPDMAARRPYRNLLQRCRRKDGGEALVEVSATPILDAAGKFAGYRGVARDVTEREKAAAALRASEEWLRQSYQELERRVAERTAELARAEARYRSIYENAPVGIFQKTLQGRFLAANAQLARIYGYGSPEELVAGAADAPASLYVDPAAWAAMRRLLSSQERLENFEVLVRRGDGRLAWTSRMVRVVRDAEGRAVFYEGFVSDVTDRRQAEEQVHSLTRELLRAQESERRRISRELHDNMAQTLSSLAIAWKTMFDGHPEVAGEVRQRAEGLAAHLSGLTRSVRDLAYDLRPQALDELGLARAVRMHCEEFADQTGLAVEFSAAGLDSLTLDTDTAINIFRLVQEALRNVAKHAGANRVVVKLVASHPHILVRVEDDGQGFDPAERRAATRPGERRMGLQSMEERVLLLKGTFKVHSRPGQGTRVFAEIPVLDLGGVR
jgi:PAS domain S-box-containing protein